MRRTRLEPDDERGSRLAAWTPENVHLRELPAAAKRTVIRLETYAGFGCYDSGGNRAHDGHIPDDLYHTLHRPNPWNDGPLAGMDILTEYCGFTCRKQLTDWFPDATGRSQMTRLAAKPTFPALYEIANDDVRSGSAQCVFKRAKARRIAWLRPDTLTRMCGGRLRPEGKWTDSPAQAEIIRD